MYQLKIKTKQLESMYEKLKDASAQLEDVTALRERNRIAREIHDTVGHTLTTVLMEMEAGERLLKTDQELALEKLRLALGIINDKVGATSYASMDTRKLAPKPSLHKLTLCGSWKMEFAALKRSEERRVGKECRTVCRSRWSPYH